MNSGMCRQTEHNPGGTKEEEDQLKPCDSAEDGVAGSLETVFSFFNNVTATHEGPGCQEDEDSWWVAVDVFSLLKAKLLLTYMYIVLQTLGREIIVELWST